MDYQAIQPFLLRSEIEVPRRKVAVIIEYVTEVVETGMKRLTKETKKML